MPDTDNKLAELKKALQEVLTFLNNQAVTTALGQIPDSIKKPVLEGLKKVLDVIKKALDELKKNLSAVTTVKDLLKVINDLLTAAEGLAPGEKETLESVKKIVQTLQDLPGAAEIEEILTLIGQIVQKLEGL
jgi:chemotaxis regulatin CheY-phosphate phosphatase CheZ